MKGIYHRLARALSCLFLLSLCLTPIVFATEGTNPPAAIENPPQESEAPPAQQETATAATGEELLNWLGDETASGTLTLSADIILADAQLFRSSGEPLTVDVGDYFIAITGEVQLLCEGLTIIGTGGEKGLLQVLPGGRLEIDYVNLVAGEGGTALTQEEGAGLLLGEACTIEGIVEHAKMPFIWYWNKSPLVVVGAGQTAQLPDTVSAQVSEQGKMESRDLSVQWALDAHQEAQAQRRRFLAQGRAEGYAMAVPPVCTVAYDDFPLTFTHVTAQERTWYYRVNGGFTKPEAALPITVAEEYSFDGVNWTTLYERAIENHYDGFDMMLEKDEGANHRWDTSAAPYLYIRLRWNNGTRDYFSNVLRFAAEDFGTAEDMGGNRGGGTDIVDPPTAPTPDLPGNDGAYDDGAYDDGNGVPRPTPDPSPDETPAPELPPDPAPVPPAISVQPTEQPLENIPPTASVDMSSKPSPADIAEESADPQTPPTASEERVDNADTPQPPASDRQTPPTSLPEKGAVLTVPEPDAVSKSPGALPIAAGCAAAASAVTIAGLYLHPQTLQRLLKLLRNIFQIK